MPSSLMGGSQSSSSSGYSALSPALKKAFDPFGAAINYFTLPQFGAPNTTIPGQANTQPHGKNGQMDAGTGGGDGMTGGRAGVTDMFTPLAQTADESRAFDMMRQGFTPTEDSIRKSQAMQMNPFMDDVMSQIQRQAYGQHSILGQDMANAGQAGSNRSILGDSDIASQQASTMGSVLGSQWNSAMNNTMNVMPNLQRQDAAGLLGIGDFMRSLDTQTKQAPITALQTGTNLMSPFLSGGKSQSTTTNGILPMMMQMAAAS